MAAVEVSALLSSQLDIDPHQSCCVVTGEPGAARHIESVATQCVMDRQTQFDDDSVVVDSASDMWAQVAESRLHSIAVVDGIVEVENRNRARTTRHGQVATQSAVGLSVVVPRVVLCTVRLLSSWKVEMVQTYEHIQQRCCVGHQDTPLGEVEAVKPWFGGEVVSTWLAVAASQKGAELKRHKSCLECSCVMGPETMNADARHGLLVEHARVVTEKVGAATATVRESVETSVAVVER